jgi:prolyl-tRNA synthetase
LRITVGMRDLENGNVEIYRRDTKEKLSMSVEQLA